ncbi:MAG: hypothetical protein PHU43_01585, partial [Candidatus Bipolaricaulis sp.]|nr:hypothetical protein [Candidatus Bipolaricaulis sp.]
MSIVIGTTLPRGAIVMADTYASFNYADGTREWIEEGRDKMRELGPEVWAAVVGELPSSSKVAESLRQDLGTLTTPKALRAAQEDRAAATWEDLQAHPPEDDDPQTLAVGLVTVGVLGGVSFLAGAFHNRNHPRDFQGPLYTKPWATWIMGEIHDIDCRDAYYAEFLAALDRHPPNPVGAVLDVGMKAITAICHANPSYRLTPVQAVVVREGKPTERLLLVASNEDPRRYA